jgi:hypothetical protein
MLRMTPYFSPSVYKLLPRRNPARVKSLSAEREMVSTRENAAELTFLPLARELPEIVALRLQVRLE